MKLLIASNNQHKIEEFGQIFNSLPLDLTWPAKLGLNLDPDETGTTFAENALIKARAFQQATGLLTLADDSGLEVDALNGEPGVYSARYGGTPKADHRARYELVLHKLAALNLADEARTARFKCVIALVAPDGCHTLVSGAVEGLIAAEPSGDYGFGYDPVFWVPTYQQTMAQLLPDVKNKISHRAEAAKAALPLLVNYLAARRFD